MCYISLSSDSLWKMEYHAMLYSRVKDLMKKIMIEKSRLNDEKSLEQK